MRCRILMHYMVFRASKPSVLWRESAHVLRDIAAEEGIEVVQLIV